MSTFRNYFNKNLVHSKFNNYYDYYDCIYIILIIIFSFLVYDLLTGNIVRTLEGHEGCVRDVSWHPYHQEIISASVSFIIFNNLFKKWLFLGFDYFINFNNQYFSVTVGWSNRLLALFFTGFMSRYWRF